MSIINVELCVSCEVSCQYDDINHSDIQGLDKVSKNTGLFEALAAVIFYM